VTDFDIV